MDIEEVVGNKTNKPAETIFDNGKNDRFFFQVLRDELCRVTDRLSVEIKDLRTEFIKEIKGIDEKSSRRFWNVVKILIAGLVSMTGGLILLFLRNS